MTKNIQEFLAKPNTSQDFTSEEVLEFTDSNIEWLAVEYELLNLTSKLTITQEELYSLIVEYKQLRDKLAQISSNPLAILKEKVKCADELCNSLCNKGTIIIGKELNTHNLLIVDKVNKDWISIKMDNLLTTKSLQELLKENDDF